MIASFRSKGLLELWTKGRTAKIDSRMFERIRRRLERLDEAHEVADLNVVGYNFHGLHGFTPTRYSVHVNGPWCLTFAFEGGHAREVDFEQYH